MKDIVIGISDSYDESLGKLPSRERKRVKAAVKKFRDNPTAAGSNFETLTMMSEKQMRSIRVNDDYRVILLQPIKGNIYTLLYADKHDAAYRWGKNKTFPIHPTIGILQRIDVVEVEAATKAIEEARPKALDEYALFETFSDEELLKAGAPTQYLKYLRILKAPQELDDIAPLLPNSAYQVLAAVANFSMAIPEAITFCGYDQPPTEAVDVEDIAAAYERSGTLEQFTLTVDDADLERILRAPLQKWRVFLHPSQRKLVNKQFNGPARVLGGAGTGKTVVAMHRARFLATELFTQNTDRILVTAFSRNLADDIAKNLTSFCGDELKRIDVLNLHRWAHHYLVRSGVTITIPQPSQMRDYWRTAMKAAGQLPKWGVADYQDEWKEVIQANGITSLEQYVTVSRVGQHTPLPRASRRMAWEVFGTLRALLDQSNQMTWLDMVNRATTQLNLLPPEKRPYQAVIVDETQDLYVCELRLIRALAPEQPNDLFLTGDAHQRIFKPAVTLRHQGIHIVGRSHKLNINYRTTEEIKDTAVAMLSDVKIDDLDGGQDTHQHYRSLRKGPEPTIRQFDTVKDEMQYVADRIEEMFVADVPLESICVVARTNSYLDPMAKILTSAERGIGICDLRDRNQTPIEGVRLSSMHRVKGLEFTHVFIVGVDAKHCPLVPENELLERCLLHVASSRARDNLTISYAGSASPYLPVPTTL